VAFKVYVGTDYPLSERCARHVEPVVAGSAPGRIRTCDPRIRRPLGLSAVLNRKIAGHW